MLTEFYHCFFLGILNLFHIRFHYTLLQTYSITILIQAFMNFKKIVKNGILFETRDQIRKAYNIAQNFSSCSVRYFLPNQYGISWKLLKANWGL